MDFITTIIVHVLAAIPPTIAAVAALIKAARTEKQTKQIAVTVNGRIEKLQSELDMARAALARKDYQ